MPKKAEAATTTSKAGKTTAASKAVAVKGKVQNVLFEKKPRTFGIGGHLPPRRDVTRFVKWPRYVRIQRQRRILYTRLKVPPSIAQFSKTLDKNAATNLFKLLAEYKPETKQAKAKRLLAAGEAKAKTGAEAKTPPPLSVKYGINNVAHLVEQKKAKLVVIAHDVDPIEIVLWLPSLCRKLEVPYVFVKGKARLGQVVHKKTASALAVVDVRKEDQSKLAELLALAREQFNNNVEARKHWGGGRLGVKSKAIVRKRERAVAAEEKARRKTGSA